MHSSRSQTLVRLMQLALALAAAPLAAQEQPARRLSSIVGVAVEEYAKGVDARGKLTSQQEYDEAVAFLNDARQVANRLSGAPAAAVRAPLDSITAAVAAKRPPADLDALHKRFVDALGTDGALEMPVGPLDLAAGRALYGRNCASCHGESGAGNGPAAKGLKTAPPAIGDAKTMIDASPALLYRVISVGVSSTPMPGWAGTLSSQDRWNLVAYLHALRASTADRLEGEGLYLQRCGSCHGNAGLGDGPASRALTKAPAEIGGFRWQVERSDRQMLGAIRGGVPGSAMPAARELGDKELARLVAYVRALPLVRGDAPTVAAAALDTSASGASRIVLSTLDQAMAAAQSGRKAEAGDKAFDAYLAFEPLETSARAKKPGLVATMERHFADFKGAVKAGDLRSAQASRDAIEAALPAIVDLTQRATSAWAAFLQSFLIILREGFEAILVIGAVAAFLRKTGHDEKLRSIWLGVGAGIAASAVTAVILATVLHAVPASAEIIGGITMLIAVAVLFSVSYWLISKVEAAKWQQFIKEKVNSALEHGGGRALVLVAFLAVYREGAETALFYQALFAEGSNVALPLTLGIIIGFGALAVIFTLFYRFGVRIPLRPFFAVTSGLLYYMAFVFVGKGIRELQEGNVVPITIIPHLPSVDAMGIFPTLETLSAQMALIVLLVFALVKTFWPKRSVTLPLTAVPSTELASRLATLEERLEQIERQSSVVSRQSSEADD
ncbi:MAG: FTR1 family protein [Gemmatimonadaceae bacterium]